MKEEINNDINLKNLQCDVCGQEAFDGYNKEPFLCKPCHYTKCWNCKN